MTKHHDRKKEFKSPVTGHSGNGRFVVGMWTVGFTALSGKPML
ncbi:hypothetical protein [Paenibacillus sp. GM2]|nr:hypothetical protein [Paenibacillus sp. GM2]